MTQREKLHIVDGANDRALCGLLVKTGGGDAAATCEKPMSDCHECLTYAFNRCWWDRDALERLGRRVKPDLTSDASARYIEALVTAALERAERPRAGLVDALETLRDRWRMFDPHLADTWNHALKACASELERALQSEARERQGGDRSVPNFGDRLIDGRPTPCPFCGNDQMLIADVGEGHAIICGKCRARGPLAETPASAIVEWVNRHAQAPAPRQAAALGGKCWSLWTDYADAIEAKDYRAAQKLSRRLMMTLAVQVDHLLAVGELQGRAAKGEGG